MAATPLNITTDSDDRRTLVYAEGRGCIGRITPIAGGSLFSAVLFEDGMSGRVRLFSTERQALAAFKYGF